jgi:hypothetical protein
MRVAHAEVGAKSAVGPRPFGMLKRVASAVLSHFRPIFVRSSTQRPLKRAMRGLERVQQSAEKRVWPTVIPGMLYPEAVLPLFRCQHFQKPSEMAHFVKNSQTAEIGQNPLCPKWYQTSWDARTVSGRFESILPQSANCAVCRVCSVPCVVCVVCGVCAVCVFALHMAYGPSGLDCEGRIPRGSAVAPIGGCEHCGRSGSSRLGGREQR